MLIETELLPSPKSLKQRLCTSVSHREFIIYARDQLKNILDGNDNRLALIVGPCSIHDIDAAKEYAYKLKVLAQAVNEEFFIVMRTYFEKARTTVGWKGLIYDPDIDGSDDVALGLEQARKLLLFLAEIQMPAATEFLDPITPRYIEDLVTWGCIGARTTESQIHRQFASGLPMPVAFKNSTSGDIDVAVNAVTTSSYPHTAFGINDEGQVSIVRTRGNPHSHIVLRGGKEFTNFDSTSIADALTTMKEAEIAPRLFVDCTHGNSKKNHEEQISVFMNVLEQRIQGTHEIKGLLLESHLFEGNQKISMDAQNMVYGVSLTDPCLDWESTEKLIIAAAKKIQQEAVCS